LKIVEKEIINIKQKGEASKRPLFFIIIASFLFLIFIIYLFTNLRKAFKPWFSLRRFGLAPCPQLIALLFFLRLAVGDMGTSVRKKTNMKTFFLDLLVFMVFFYARGAWGRGLGGQWVREGQFLDSCCPCPWPWPPRPQELYKRSWWSSCNVERLAMKRSVGESFPTVGWTLQDELHHRPQGRAFVKQFLALALKAKGACRRVKVTSGKKRPSRAQPRPRDEVVFFPLTFTDAWASPAWRPGMESKKEQIFVRQSRREPIGLRTAFP
jgi:hypothetical protein